MRLIHLSCRTHAVDVLRNLHLLYPPPHTHTQFQMSTFPSPRRTHAADVLRNLHVITTRGGLMRILSSGAKLNKKPSPPLTREQSFLSPSSSQLDVGLQPRRTSAPSSVGGAAPKPVSLGIPAEEIGTSDSLTLLAMYLSAIIHDYDHRGVTNAFLIQDEDPLAVS